MPLSEDHTKNSEIDPPADHELGPTFRDELEQIINKHSVENGSNTPDFILADYMHDCLKAFDNATKRRDLWHGRPVVERRKYTDTLEGYLSDRYGKGVEYKLSVYKERHGEGLTRIRIQPIAEGSTTTEFHLKRDTTRLLTEEDLADLKDTL